MSYLTVSNLNPLTSIPTIFTTLEPCCEFVKTSQSPHSLFKCQSSLKGNEVGQDNLVSFMTFLGGVVYHSLNRNLGVPSPKLLLPILSLFTLGTCLCCAAVASRSGLLSFVHLSILFGKVGSSPLTWLGNDSLLVLAWRPSEFFLYNLWHFDFSSHGHNIVLKKRRTNAQYLSFCNSLEVLRSSKQVSGYNRGSKSRDYFNMKILLKTPVKNKYY